MPDAELSILREQVAKLRRALQVAINTVECASLDKDGTELPWYVGAKAALGDSEPEQKAAIIADLKRSMGIADDPPSEEMSGRRLQAEVLPQPTIADAIRYAVLEERARCVRVAKDVAAGIAEDEGINVEIAAEIIAAIGAEPERA